MEVWVSLYRRFSNSGLLSQLLSILSLLLLLLYFASASRVGGDFASYLEAAGKMIQGTNIYDPPHIHLRYSYSPFWAMILMPLALLPMAVGVFIWLIGNVFFLWRSIYLLRNYFGVKFEDSRRDWLLWSLIFIYMSRFIELNFHHAQMTIFLLMCILESIRLSDMGRNIEAGIIIGVATIIKIMPVVMIPYFIYRKKFTAAFWSVIMFIVSFFLPVLYVGRERFIALNLTWFQILRPDSADFQADNVGYFPHNLSAMLYRLLMPVGAPYMKNILSLDYDLATRCIWFTILVLIVSTIYFLATRPFQKVESTSHELYEISYITLIMPLIFPHQMKYAFYFLLPAICCLMKVVIDSYSHKRLTINLWITISFLVLAFLLCTATTDLIIGMKLSVITQYLKTITIGTLLLIPALAINRKYFVK